MSTAMVKGTDIGSTGVGPSILSERQARIPVAGKIRSGIKVLTAAGKQHPKAQAIYDGGVAAGKRWKEIEKELIDTCGFQKSPLTPKNTAYFTVRRHDFVTPECADEIMRLYAEDRGEGLRLYRLPIIFPMDSWMSVMPHGLHCYTRNELVYWSEYEQDGKRYCKTRAPVPIDEKSKRAQRPWGGRQTVVRAENEGLCDPAKCPEYQARKCNLTGSFLFYVPGIPGSSAIELPTTSFYSMQQARAKLEMVAYLRGGKISGTLDGKPFFFLTKKQHEVSMIDPQTGQPKKVKQWLIEIEANIDMTRVFQMGEARAIESAGTEAVAALEAPADNADDIDADESEEAPPADNNADDETAPLEVTAEAPQAPAPAVAPVDEAKEKIKAARKHVADGLNILGIAPEHFAKYGVAKWGAGWSGTLEGLNKAKATLQQSADDPSALDEIKNWTGE